MRLGTLVPVLVFAAQAAAGPYKETIARADLDAIVKAIQAALPPVNQTAVEPCKATLDEYNRASTAPDALDHVAKAAACFRAAGAIGAAVQSWTLIDKYASTAQLALQRDALRGLGSAFETSAYFSRASEAYAHFATKFATESDAESLLSRALCIDRQLGDEAAVRRDTAAWKFKTKLDADAVCASLHPIQMPAKPATH